MTSGAAKLMVTRSRILGNSSTDDGGGGTDTHPCMTPALATLNNTSIPNPTVAVGFHTMELEIFSHTCTSLIATLGLALY